MQTSHVLEEEQVLVIEQYLIKLSSADYLHDYSFCESCFRQRGPRRWKTAAEAPA